MSSSSEERAGVAPALEWPADAKRAVRWICTNNPFYVVSAGLFLAGLWISFGDPRQIENTWALMSGLGGYTLLLAATAYLLVRFVKLWDDARTVLLLVVLMFLATSVTFDEVLVLEAIEPGGAFPMRGFISYGVGLAFALAVTMGLLRGIRLNLPTAYRVPYYLILGLFFLYPLALSPLLRDPHGEALQWGLFGFSSIAGLLFLTLLPAIRRGAAYVEGNGSPWPWPMYPWSLFFILALAVCGRAVLLCWSMHPVGANLDRLIFGPYFLVPFGLSLAVLLLEMGLSWKKSGAVVAALSAPALLALLSVIGHRGDPTYQQFLASFASRLGGDPVFWTLLACAGFYAYAMARHATAAFELFTAALALLAIAGMHSVQAGPLAAPLPAPLMIAATLLLGIGVWRRQSWRCILGALGLTAALALALPADGALAGYRGVAAFHVMLLAVLIVGATFDDEVAHGLRLLGALFALAAGLGAIFAPPEHVPLLAAQVYPLALAAVIGGYGFALGHGASRVVAGAIFGIWTLACGWQAYRACRQLVAGMDYLAGSLLVFGLAILVSLAKAGVLSRWASSWRERASD